MYKYIKKDKRYSLKFFFDGKSYKLSIKPKLYNFRFNRVNKTILLVNNLNTFTKGLRKKIYIYNTLNTKIKNKLIRELYNIRKYNTYTIRGIYTSNSIINKRVGRVSEYV